MRYVDLFDHLHNRRFVHTLQAYVSATVMFQLLCPTRLDVPGLRNECELPANIM